MVGISRLVIGDRKERSMNSEKSEKEKKLTKQDLALLLSYVEDIEYGSVTLKIHDGKVVQIEKSEKIKV
jgi:hypothetical protein